MGKVLRWYATFVHSEHANKSQEPDWSNCDLWPCYHLQQAVLKGVPVPYTEMDGAGTY